MKKIICSLALLIMVSSCQKFINWGKWTFNQGCNVDTYACVPRQHIRSVRVYDQFNTISIIDALWLSDAVRVAYADLYAQKNYFSSVQKEKMIDHELQQNSHALSFYILIWQQAQCGGTLDRSNAFWNLVLTTDSGSYQPRIIKPVDLPCEYATFFGKRMNSFQKAYYVEFDAYTSDNQSILDGITFMTLCFSSLTKKTFVRWDIVDGRLCFTPKENDCAPWEKCDNCKDLVVE